MPSHVQVIDAFVVEDPRLKCPAKIVLRSDLVVELYAVEDGLEKHAGHFALGGRLGRDVFTSISDGIARRISENPVSRTSLGWLSALDRLGLLTG